MVTAKAKSMINTMSTVYMEGHLLSSLYEYPTLSFWMEAISMVTLIEILKNSFAVIFMPKSCANHENGHLMGKQIMERDTWD